jgi:hypothetical protein
VQFTQSYFAEEAIIVCMNSANVDIPEDATRLLTLQSYHHTFELATIIDALKRDSVVLVQDVSPDDADSILQRVSDAVGLLASLQLQSTFAAFWGHRRRVGKFLMTVNERGDCQYIPPHSEGDSFTNVQLASFYCFENTTDGGETIALNVDDSSEAWQSLREKVVRLVPGSRRMTAGELARARGLYHLQSLNATLEDDQILCEAKSDLPGVLLNEVLTRARRTRSVILNRESHVYWDSVSSIDFDSWHAYERLLKHSGLIKNIEKTAERRSLDNAVHRRIWSSGVDHSKLFRCKITYKLRRGDLLLQNNITWAHAVANWRSNSGVRRVAAAFA